MAGVGRAVLRATLALALALCGGPSGGGGGAVAGRVLGEAEKALRPLVKTEVADLLGVTTRTVDRYVRRGVLCAGRKRRGHKTLYWLMGDVEDCLSARPGGRDKDKKKRDT